MTDLQNQKQKFEYNDNLDMTGVTDAKGNSFKYEYDKNHNVTKGTSAEKRILRYTYDDKENVLKSAAVSAADETTGTWMTRTMTDDKNHVAAVKDARGYQVTYAWDTKKDLLNSVKDARNSTTFYTYDAKTERLTSVSKTVKAKGQDQEVKVEYGYSNDRLTRENNESLNKTVTYYYDHTGARVKKVVDGVTTEYRMAGSLLVSERTGDETIWYQYDSAASLVAMIIGGTRYNYVRNDQNDIVGLIDSTGKRVVSYKYDSWGKVVSITGTLAVTVGQKNPFRYRGYYFDAESGMYYLQSRYYDPEIRRFISADESDTLKEDLENLGQYNLYGYCFANPICLNDDDGTWPSWATKIAIGVGAVLIGAAVVVATGGAGFAVAAIGEGIKVAAGSAVIGAVSGAGTAAISHRVKTGSWKGTGSAVVSGAIEGAADGFMWGGITAGSGIALGAYNKNWVTKIGRINGQNEKGYYGVRYASEKTDRVQFSFELHTPHKNDHNFWHWQKNTWESKNKIWKRVSKKNVPRWDLFGRRVK